MVATYTRNSTQDPIKLSFPSQGSSFKKTSKLEEEIHAPRRSRRLRRSPLLRKWEAIFLYFSADTGFFCLLNDEVEREFPKSSFLKKGIRTPNQPFEFLIYLESDGSQRVELEPLRKSEEGKLVRKNTTDFSKLRIDSLPQNG